MKISNIGLIIGREYSTRVKKKSFILLTILTPLLMAALMFIPVVIALYSGEDKQVISIVDNTGLLEGYFESNGKTEYKFLPVETTQESLKQTFETYNSSTLIYVSALDAEGNASVTAYSREPLGMETKMAIEGKIGNALRDRKLRELDIQNFDEIMDKVRSEVKIDAYTLTNEGKEKKDTVEIYMIIAYVLSFLIYMFVAVFGSMVMRGVIEEKTNRIVEVIVSSVSSFELMMGKLLGVALVALTQFAIWMILIGAVIFGLQGVVTSQMADKMADVTATMSDATTAIQETSVGIHPTADMGSLGEISSVLEQVSQINFPQILLCFLIYFVLGYLLYAAMFAAVGSAVDNEADTNQLSLPITIPLMIGLFIMLHTFQHPSSQLSIWASMIPFTSPMVMLARIPFGVVPAWQLILSVVLLIATFVTIAWASAKIYKVGILTYGKKATFKDLFKWLKYKD
ncbi:MAG: ABC transporter permease [Bacteroidales bacterium]|nr:ABC transporter permease [Bacteroidales bacterium]